MNFISTVSVDVIVLVVKQVYILVRNSDAILVAEMRL
jgi:hypothetical protein